MDAGGPQAKVRAVLYHRRASVPGTCDKWCPWRELHFLSQIKVSKGWDKKFGVSGVTE